MTIQISVVIWTVLSFCVFIFVVSRFLFKPLLSVMDARQKKIEDARSARNEIEERFEEDRARYESERVELQRSAVARAEEELSQAQSTGAAAVRDARADYEARLDELRIALGEESKVIAAQLDDQVDSLALEYAKALVT